MNRICLYRVNGFILQETFNLVNNNNNKTNAMLPYKYCFQAVQLYRILPEPTTTACDVLILLFGAMILSFGKQSVFWGKKERESYRTNCLFHLKSSFICQLYFVFGALLKVSKNLLWLMFKWYIFFLWVIFILESDCLILLFFLIVFRYK